MIDYKLKSWTVVGFSHKDYKANKYWICACDNCGNEIIRMGSQLKRNIISICQCHKINRMVGKKFGYLTIIGLHYIKRHTFWLCRCCCGKDHIVRESHLLEGSITSCGCMKHEKSKKYFRQALLGKKFGKWTVLDFACRKKEGNVYRLHWLCECVCGTKRTVSGKELTSGNSLSCGCSRTSVGEEEVAIFLDQNDIIYSREHSFDGCVDVNLLRFDFYLPDHKTCIEFHGKQHYEPIKRFGGQQRLEAQQRRDQIKRDYCKEHDIHLIEIPYWKKVNTELLQLI